MVDKEDLKLFISEMEDLVQKTEEEIMKLEENPNNPKPLQELFFTFHTLKGLTAMVGFDNVSRFCHYFESFLEKAKENKFSKEKRDGFINLLFENFEILRTVLKRVKKGDMSDIESNFLVDIEETFKNFDNISGESLVQLSPPDELLNKLDDPKNHSYKISIRLEKTCVFKRVRVFIIFRALNEYGQIYWTNPKPEIMEEGQIQQNFEVFYLSQKTVQETTQVLDEILEIENKVIIELNSAEYKNSISEYKTSWEKSLKLEIKDESTLDENREEEVIDGEDELHPEAEVDFKMEKITSLKVNVEKVENLMNYFGELVILKNQINQILQEIEERRVIRLLDKMDKPLLDIQEILFELKLVRVESTFRKYKRLVRDVARDTGKKVKFILEGINVEIDRKILEELNSPLVHILRNSVSHGIEPPKRRKSKNKNEIGTLKLKTSRRAGSIYIEIQDDGKGIDYDKIKQKIIKKGLYNSEEVKSLSKDDLNQIILMPGFSTLSDVDIISGRGMGLAIVSEKIKELGGTFKISSEKDKGTIMTLIVPFTRAILKAQLMKVNGDLFAIPTENIDQVIIFNQNLVEYDEEQVYYNFASQLVPMIQLDQYFNFISSGESNITTNSDIKIAVLCKKDEFNSIVIVVDELLQQMDVVVKPFKSSFSNSHDILGSTITGDGSICLILDVLTMMSSILNIN